MVNTSSLVPLPLQGFFDSAESAAKKHDIVAASIGRTVRLNFPLSTLLEGSRASGGNGGGASVAVANSAAVANHVNAAAGRWAWRCDVEVDRDRLAASITSVLTHQMHHCPGVWKGGERVGVKGRLGNRLFPPAQ